MNNKSFISLIMPVKNEGENIKNIIESAISVKTDYDFEIIVVDDHSEDDCCSFLEKNENEKIKLIRREGLGVSQMPEIPSLNLQEERLSFFAMPTFFSKIIGLTGLFSPLKKE